MVKYLNNILTARNNRTYSGTKLAFFLAVGCLSWNFVSTHSDKFTEYGLAVTGLIGAMAYKYSKEGEPDAGTSSNKDVP